jgi:hypothetical protein
MYSSITVPSIVTTMSIDENAVADRINKKYMFFVANPGWKIILPHSALSWNWSSAKILASPSLLPS